MQRYYSGVSLYAYVICKGLIKPKRSPLKKNLITFAHFYFPFLNFIKSSLATVMTSFLINNICSYRETRTKQLSPTSIIYRQHYLPPLAFLKHKVSWTDWNSAANSTYFYLCPLKKTLHRSQWDGRRETSVTCSAYQTFIWSLLISDMCQMHHKSTSV